MFAQQNHGKVNVENAVLKSCKKCEFALSFQKNGQACVFISLLIKIKEVLLQDVTNVTEKVQGVSQ